MSNDNIRALRKALDLTQSEFGRKIGVSRNVINNLELGRVEPSDLIINMLCKTYNVDPTWLETGEGEMFRALSRREEIADFVGKTLADDSGTLTAEFTLKLVAVLAKLDAECWQKLAEVALAIKEAEDEYDAETKKEGG